MRPSPRRAVAAPLQNLKLCKCSDCVEQDPRGLYIPRITHRTHQTRQGRLALAASNANASPELDNMLPPQGSFLPSPLPPALPYYLDDVLTPLSSVSLSSTSPSQTLPAPGDTSPSAHAGTRLASPFESLPGTTDDEDPVPDLEFVHSPLPSSRVAHVTVPATMEVDPPNDSSQFDSAVGDAEDNSDSEDEEGAAADEVLGPVETYARSSIIPLVRMFGFLVCFLFLRMHIGVRSSDIILRIVKLVLVELRLLPLATDREVVFPTTLHTSMKRLGLADSFSVYPLCPSCWHLRLDPAPPDETTVCAFCSAPLYIRLARSILDFLPIGRKRSGASRKATTFDPLLAVPVALLSEQLPEFLSHDGVEDALEEWKFVERNEDTMNDVMDGAIWKELQDPERKVFFTTEAEEELHLGFTISLDWFQPRSSSYAPSHSSGSLSASCANLRPAIRDRVLNVLTLLFTPGPNEPTCEQLQNLLKIVVDDFLKLWTDGVVVKTRKYPAGRLVRVAIIATICDHPALCKMLGFADHSHKNCPCPICTITTDQLHDDISLTGEGYPERTDAEVRRLAELYRSLPTDKARAEFFKEHGIRWSEFNRLPYFDMVRMGVIDPMHNIFLGVVKTQWYPTWIQGNALRADTEAGTERELSFIQKLIRNIESPPWAARLPKAVGEPAGGSLTADEYKHLATVFGPMVIPLVWHKFSGQAASDYPRELERYAKALEAQPQKEQDYRDRIAQRKGGKTPRKPNKLVEPLRPRMVPDEADYFLLLSEFVTIVTAPSVRRADVLRAHEILRAYIKGFKKNNQARTTPNHHWVLHTHQFIADFGPVYGFWAFLSERLNYRLKQFNSNNWDRGRMEVSMMRSFLKDAAIESMLAAISRTVPGGELGITSVEVKAAQLLSTLSNSQIQGPANSSSASEENDEEPDEDEEHGYLRGLQYGLSPTPKTAYIPARLTRPLARAYNDFFTPSPPIVPPDTRIIGGRGQALTSKVHYHPYFTLGGRRIIPSSHARIGRTLPTRSSLVRARVGAAILYGEVLDILEHQQLRSDRRFFAHMRWMVPVLLNDTEDLWAGHRHVLDVQVFHLDQYQPSVDSRYPVFVPLQLIECAISRVTYAEAKWWLAISLPTHGPAK